MVHARHSLKALGVCLMAALGLMTVMAVGAQAATWLESGVTIVTLLAIESEKDSAIYILHSELTGGTSIRIECTNLALTEGNLHANGTATGTLGFTGCTTKINGVTSTACAPKEPISAKVKVEQYLHTPSGGTAEHLFLFSPADGTLKLTVVKLDKNGSECSVGPNFEVSGHFIFKDCENKALVDQVKHLIEPIVGTGKDLVGHENSIKFGKFPVTLLGSVWVKLQSGNAWAGHV